MGPANLGCVAGRSAGGQLPRVLAIAVGVMVGATCSTVLAATELERLIQQMPGNSWLRVNTNQFWEVWTPPDQRPVSWISPASNISGWSGAAWDRSRRRLMIFGGDVGNERGNEVYYFDTTDLRWHRASLPSAMLESADKRPYAIDGTDNAPRSGESYDNLVYLENLDRLLVINASWNGPGFRREDAITRTGPYLWDPSRADPDMVGGTNGSQVNPIEHPEVVGGAMWENRDTWARFGLGGAGYSGVSAAIDENGVDVVYWGECPANGGRLHKFSFYDMDPLNDRWEIVGRSDGTFQQPGSGAYDSLRKAFVRISGPRIMYWNLETPGPTNYHVPIAPAFDGIEPWSLSELYGIDYDSVNDMFVLWAGSADVWWLEPPPRLGPDGWRARQVRPGGDPPPDPNGLSAPFTGVFGKWIYLPDERAFIGVVDGETGDVWVYRAPIDSRNGRSLPYTPVGSPDLIRQFMLQKRW